jgi:hypothetical protein
MSKAEEETEDDDRTTAYVIDELGKDYEKALERLQASISEPDGEGNHSYDESQARDLYRALFAFLEGTSFSARIWSAKVLLDEGTLDEFERAVIGEQAVSLRDGAVVLTPMKVSLQENIRFTFNLTDRAHKVPTQTLDTSKSWWSDFKKAVKVRDRLTHPKLPDDLDISGDEVVLAIRVHRGFVDLLESYPPHRGQCKP